MMQWKCVINQEAPGLCGGAQGVLLSQRLPCPSRELLKLAEEAYGLAFSPGYSAAMLLSNEMESAPCHTLDAKPREILTSKDT